LLWLEEQNLPAELLSIKFLSEEDLKKCLVGVKNNLLHFSFSGKMIPISEDEKEYLFILDLQKQLLICEESKTIHHDSLSHGKAVFGSGTMIIKRGVISSISLDSGHYQPTPFEGIQILSILQEKGIKISPFLKIEFFEDGEKSTLTVEKFIQRFENGQNFLD
jgi:hypothetical protein